MNFDEGDLIRGNVRIEGYRRVSHGLYLRDRAGLTDSFLANLCAWQLVLPDDAVFTHVTAARLLGWWLPALPEPVPVFAATRQATNHSRRHGLCCSRLTGDEAARSAQGLPVDGPGEILLRAARDLAFLDLMPVVDSAYRFGGPGVAAQIDAICDSSRPGVRHLRVARAMADARAESAWETLLRLFHVSVGVSVEPQFVVRDDNGREVARADLLVRGTTSLHEYDGGDHLGVGRQRVDLRRARGLLRTPYVRRGYTADDLLNHPAAVLRDVDDAVGRQHQPARLATWRRWVRESAYSEEGRRRLINRWWRLTGPTDWSQTA